MSFWDETTTDDEGPIIVRRRAPQDAELDMTPMIDVTFLLLIFFLVSTALQDPHIALPKAVYGVGVDPRASVVVTVAASNTPGKPLIYLADGKAGTPLVNDPAAQEAALRTGIERGTLEGKNQLLLKGEQGLRVKDVKRILSVASTVENVRLYLAVKEAE